jgi:hypothetical protein
MEKQILPFVTVRMPEIVIMKTIAQAAFSGGPN